MKLKAKHFAWIYLIKEGSVGDWSYYGGGFCDDKQLTDLAYHDILDHGIDWSKTKAPTDSYESTFEGTDQPSGNINTMGGKLFTGNGNSYTFKCAAEYENIFEVMENISGVESLEQFVSEKLFKEL